MASCARRRSRACARTSPPRDRTRDADVRKPRRPNVRQTSVVAHPPRPASTGPTPASPSRASPTTTPRSGRRSRRSSSAARWRCVRCPDGIGGQHFSRSTPGRASTAAIALVKDPTGGRTADQHPRPRRPDRARAVRDARNPSLGVDRSTDWERPDMIMMDLDPGEDVAWTAVIAAAQEVRDRLEDCGPCRLRQDLGRQGPSRRCAHCAEGRMAGGQGLHQVDRRCHGGRQPRPLRGDDPEGEAPRQDPDRLSAQPARHDRRRRLLDPRPARRAGLDAAGVGGTRPRYRPGLFHRPQHADPARLARPRPLGGFPRGRGLFLF